MDEYVELLPGTSLGEDGRYVIRSTLGRGGFALTYLADDSVSGAAVAVKEFFPKDLAERKEGAVAPASGKEELFGAAKEAFCKEFSLLAGLNKASVEGVPKVKELLECGGTAYIVEEYVEGVSLSDYVASKGGMIGWVKTASLLRPIAELSKTLHSMWTVHGDISPSNIIVPNKGNAVLTDFGSVNMPMRTLKHGYAAPEAYDESIKPSPAFDIYSLAATAYRCLSGVVPPKATERLASDTLKPPSDFGSDIPKEAEKILMQALALAPQERVKTDDELINMFALSGAAGQPLGQAAPTPMQEPEDVGEVTVILKEEAQAPEEVTVILDCSEKTKGDSYAATPADIAKEKSAKAAENLKKFINENRAMLKKAAACAAIIILAIAGGIFGYKGIYLNSSGQLLKRAQDSIARDDYAEGYMLAKRSLEKGNKDAEVFILEVALERGIEHTPDYDLKRVIEKSMEYAEDNDNYFLQVLLCYNWSRGMSNSSYHRLFKEMIPFENVRRYTDAIIESSGNSERPAYASIVDQIYERVGAYIIDEAIEKRNVDMVTEGVGYWRHKPGMSDVRADELETQYKSRVEARINQDRREKEREEQARQRAAERERRRQEEAKRQEQIKKEREQRRQEEAKRQEQRRAEREQRRQEEAKRQEQRRAEREQRRQEDAKRQEQRRQEREAGNGSKTTQSNTNNNQRGGTLSDRVNSIRKGAN